MSKLCPLVLLPTHNIAIYVPPCQMDIIYHVAPCQMVTRRLEYYSDFFEDDTVRKCRCWRHPTCDLLVGLVDLCLCEWKEVCFELFSTAAASD